MFRISPRISQCPRRRDAEVVVVVVVVAAVQKGRSLAQPAAAGVSYPQKLYCLLIVPNQLIEQRLVIQSFGHSHWAILSLAGVVPVPTGGAVT